jgi:DUF4097 and DUF4098 domain-containing protein YvlB
MKMETAMKTRKFNLGQILVFTFLWTVGFSIVAIVGVKHAMQENPDLWTKLAKDSDLHINFNHGGVFMSGDYAPTEEQLNFTVPSHELTVRVVSADIIVKSGTGDKVQVLAKGELNKSVAEHLVKIQSTAEDLQISADPEEASRDLHLTIILPEKFAGGLVFQSVSGDIGVDHIQAKSLDLKTVSGDLHAKALSVADFNATTVGGNVSVENQQSMNGDIKSVSGDVSLRLQQPDKTTYGLRTISGDVANTHGSDPDGKFKIYVKTTSGNITIE